jgi:hypothetical protein
VADEVNGIWEAAIEVPGLASLGGDSKVKSLSCASAGNCAAGGTYLARSGSSEGFVADEVDGRWLAAREIPGLSALNIDSAGVNSISCASAGNCAAGGSYSESTGSPGGQGFVAEEINGRWRAAEEVPGLGELNADRLATVLSVSCTSPGNCGAGGLYEKGQGSFEGFVVDEVHNVWRSAKTVPGLGARHSGVVSSVSCASPGNCAAGGSYALGGGFLAGEVNGTWHAVTAVPGLRALNVGGHAHVNSVSCASAGYCAAGGDYTDSTPAYQGFVADEVNGTWHAAEEVAGIRALRSHNDAIVTSVSCASAGNCAAGGQYADPAGAHQGFIADEVNGTWHAAEELPELGALNVKGDANVYSVSCAPSGNCAAVGAYLDSSGHQGFVSDGVVRAPKPSKLSIANTVFPHAQRGMQYAVQLAASGGKSPYHWSVIHGNLPAGLALKTKNARGAGVLMYVSGTPTTLARDDFEIRATDSGSPGKRVATLRASIVVAKPFRLVFRPRLPVGVIGVRYEESLSWYTEGGRPPYHWSISGSLPAGIKFNASTGDLVGWPHARGTYRLKGTVVDTSSHPVTIARSLSIRVRYSRHRRR